MKTAAKIVLLLQVTFVLAVGPGISQEPVREMLEGTETPVSDTSDETGSCIVFTNYVIRTGVSDEGGEDLTVYTRGNEKGCQITRKPLLYVANEDNNAFWGLAGRMLFVDSGTSVESRGLEVFDLEKGTSIIGFVYSGEPRLEDGRTIRFDAPSETPGPIRTCKEAAKWKREGGSVGWVQGKRLDLDTLKQTNVGGLRCIYMQ